MPKPKATGKRRVRFELKGAKGSDVRIAGSFNDWEPARNKLTWKTGVYSTTVLLAPGKYEYKFVIDDVWCADPECAEWAPNGLGSLNSVKVVG